VLNGNVQIKFGVTLAFRILFSFLLIGNVGASLTLKLILIILSVHVGS